MAPFSQWRGIFTSPVLDISNSAYVALSRIHELPDPCCSAAPALNFCLPETGDFTRILALSLPGGLCSGVGLAWQLPCWVGGRADGAEQAGVWGLPW